MKFRKKPVVIDAIQYTKFNKEEIDSFVGKVLEMNIESETAYEAGIAPPMFSLNIQTLEGVMKAQEGDWIIKGVSGEFYPCKPDIFEKTYEPAPEGEKAT